MKVLFKFCYNIDNGVDDEYTAFTSDELASGALCYKLNGESSKNVYWYQTLGTDAHPVTSTDSKIVYKFTNCSNGSGYSNDAATASGTHTYNDYGICIYNSEHYAQQGNIIMTDGVYQIASANDLVTFAKVVNSDHCTKAKAKVTADINASSVSYTPIGSDETYYYAGEFDGGGKTITLNINNPSSRRQGLFSNIGAATIKNVNVAGTITGKSRVGGIVGNVVAGETTITNCSNSATVSGSQSYAGGIVAYASSKTIITGCANSGTVSGNGYVGGIMGSLTNTDVTIEKCVNENGGAVSSTADNQPAGGILGGVYDASSDALKVKVIACANRGTISGSSIYAGGIVGYYRCSFAITSCYNEVSGLKLYGTKANGGTQTFERCYNITSCSNAKTFTPDELKSGALCFNLNGGVTDMYWYQKIGTDANPILTALKNEANVVNKVGYTKIEYGKDNVESGAYFNTGATSVVLNDDAKLFYVVGEIVATDKAKEGLKETSGTNVLVKGDDKAYTCANAVLLDNTNYAVPYAYTAEKFTYERTLATDDKGITTFMLPIKTAASNVNGTVYKLTGFANNTLNFEKVTGDLTPNTPYLVENTTTGSTQKLFTSTLEGVSVSAMAAGKVEGGKATHYAFYTTKNSTDNGNESYFSGYDIYGYADGKFVKATGTWTLPAFHTLIAVPGTSNAPSLSIDLGDGDTSGISSAEANGDGESVNVYSISGVKVRTNVNSGNALRDLPAGVYIVNGKKVVVKK